MIDSSRANLSVVVAMTTMLALLLPGSPVSQAVGIVGLVACSGSLFVVRFDGTRLPLTCRILLGVGAGWATFLLVGAAIGAGLPLLGVTRSLARVPVVTAWSVLLLGYAVVSFRRQFDPIRLAAIGLTRRQVAWLAILALPPLVSLWAASILNDSGSSALAIVVAVAVVAMVVVAVWAPRGRWVPPPALLLGSAFVTGALQGPLRGGWLAGIDIQHEYYVGSLGIQQARFPLTHYVDPYGGMLSLTVLPTELHSLVAFNLRTTLVVLPSIFLGLTLLVVWTALRERLCTRLAALLCGLFVVGSEPLLRELPQITRQCYALFFFSLLVLAVSSRVLPVRAARFMAACGGVGIAVTHYSTAYLAAGAVLVGYVGSRVAREDRAVRVLNLPVVAWVVGSAAIWGGVVAKTGSSIGQVLSSIRTDGFAFLPGTGGLTTKWLNAASVSQLVNAHVIRAADLLLLHGRYHWMVIPHSAFHVPLINDPSPTASGVPVLGSVFVLAGTLLAQLVLLATIVSVVVCVTRCRSDARLAGITGMGVFFLIFSAVSRLSQTVGIDFGPSRVQAQAYLLFVVLVAATIDTTRVRAWLTTVHDGRARRTLGLTVALLLAAVAVSTSTGLFNLSHRGGQLPAELSPIGEQEQRLLSPTDVQAASWLASNRDAAGLVQADRFGQLALDVYGYNDRRYFISSVDPVIVDTPSWLFLYHTNLTSGSGRGGDNAKTGVFQFPLRYFTLTRSVLYASASNLVIGRIQPPRPT